LVARVSPSLISPPFLIKIKHPHWKEYLICGFKYIKDFQNCKKILATYPLKLAPNPLKGAISVVFSVNMDPHPDLGLPPTP
jgi:hypothetical protein